MNWYIAICSMIAGFTLGIAVVKFKDLAKLREGQDEFIRIFIENNKARNDQLKEIFNSNRAILQELIRRRESP